MKIFSEILLRIQKLRTTAHVTLLFTRPIFPNSLGIQLEHEERLSLYSLTMAIFSVSGAEVRLHTEQPVHFSLGTLPQNPRYSHNPTAVRFLGLSLDRPPRPLPRSHCRPQSLCSVVSSRAPVNQISQIAPQVSPHHHPTPCPPLPTALPLRPPRQELWRRNTCEEKDDYLEGLPPQRP